MASLGVSLDGRGSGQSDNVGCEPRHCASKDTLSEPDLAHVCKCVLGRKHPLLVSHLLQVELEVKRQMMEKSAGQQNSKVKTSNIHKYFVHLALFIL